MIEYKKEDIVWEPPPIQPCGTCSKIVTTVEYYWKPAKQVFCNAECALKAYTNHYGHDDKDSFCVTGIRKK